MSFDMGELFTAAVRRVMPHLHERKLASTFDIRGPRVIIGAEAADMHRALHRLMLGLADLVRIGFVVLHATTRITRPGRCVVEIKLAGTGLLAPPAIADTVLERLQLSNDDGSGEPQRPRLRRAIGACPATGATIRFASMPAEGLLFTADWTLPVEDVDDTPLPDAHQARAWIVDSDEVAAQSLARRLQRLGWATMRFDSAAAAVRRLRALPPGQARPALVVAVECASVSPASVQAMRLFLPHWTLCVYAAMTGSPTLARDDGVAGFEVHVFPLGPKDLEAITLLVSPNAELGSGATRPAPMSFGQRPVAFVVDGDDGACVRTSAVLATLGLEPEAVTGADRLLAMCRERAPSAVFIELGDEGPSRIDAFTAARALRARETVGDCVPCVVIATAPAFDEALWREARDAGFDALLQKPLAPGQVAAELRRLDVAVPLAG